jgi:hypothetical protein
MKIPISKSRKTRKIVWMSIVLLSLLAYIHQQTLCVYCEYAKYKLANELGEDNLFTNGYLQSTLSSAKKAGYICPKKQLPGSAAYQEVTRRRKNFPRSYLYAINDCVTLPTGEIILNINESTSRYYILLQVDASKKGGYHILDIRGETLG